MGGFFGAASLNDCINDVFFGTDYHSHLGTKRGGMTAYSPELGFQRSIHSIENSPFRTKFEKDIETMKGNLCIGCISDTDPQPILLRSKLGLYAVCNIGIINNAAEIRDEILNDCFASFESMSSGKVNSSSLIGALIAQKDNFVDGIRNAQEKIKGTVSLMVLTEDGRTEIISGRPSRDKSFGILETRVDYNTREAQLLLQHGHDITVTSGEESRTVQTRSETVDHLLHRLHMEPADDEMVFIDFTGDTPSIYFRTEMTRQRTVQLSVGYSSRRVVNHTLAKGTERVMQQGVPGTITKTYTDTYRMGCVVSTELTDTVTDGAVEEVVEYGTRVTSVDRSDQLVSVHSNGDGSGYLLFASGDTMTFSRTLVCSATAYSIGTRTASGRPTAVGNIAVDTSVFPYGTRMYVQTVKGSWHLGMATAADCGTAIKGNKIDLWFKTFSEACDWGRRDCTVYVLD